MNTQAAFKTFLVVLAIGAVSGYGEWKKVYGGTPAERSAKELASCIAAGKLATYQKNPWMGKSDIDASNQKAEAACQKQVQAKFANSDLPAYLSQSK